MLKLIRGCERCDNLNNCTRKTLILQTDSQESDVFEMYTRLRIEN